MLILSCPERHRDLDEAIRESEKASFRGTYRTVIGASDHQAICHARDRQIQILISEIYALQAELKEVKSVQAEPSSEVVGKNIKFTVHKQSEVNTDTPLLQFDPDGEIWIAGIRTERNNQISVALRRLLDDSHA